MSSIARRSESEDLTEELIRSTANPLVKRVRALKQRKHRREESAFFVEGIQPVWQAVESRASVEVLIVAPDLLISEPARRLVQEQAAAGLRVAAVSPAVFESISERENPSGLAAIVRMPERSLEDLRVTPQSLFVALYQVKNPGNLGTVLRTMDATGGSGVILVGDTTDPYHPTAVRASMGALFTVPTVHADDLPVLLAWRQVHRLAVITTSARAPQSLWSVRYPLPALLLFGSEGEGLPDPIIGEGDLAVRIPMAGSLDSLNLAVAAGVMLYEVQRQRESG